MSSTLYNCTECGEQSWEVRIVLKRRIALVCKPCDNIQHARLFKTIAGVSSAKRCKECKIPLIKTISKFKESKLKKSYYYTHTDRCPQCRKMYMNEEYKVLNSNYEESV